MKTLRTAVFMHKNLMIIVTCCMTSPTQIVLWWYIQKYGPSKSCRYHSSKLRQVTRPNQQYCSYQPTTPLWAYNCGACGGNYSIEWCPIINPMKWCKNYRRLTNHKTSKCYNRMRYVTENANQPIWNQTAQTVTTIREQLRLILGSQPTPLGTG